jgi:hypothetical protein
MRHASARGQAANPFAPAKAVEPRVSSPLGQEIRGEERLAIVRHFLGERSVVELTIDVDAKDVPAFPRLAGPFAIRLRLNMSWNPEETIFEAIKHDLQGREIVAPFSRCDVWLTARGEIHAGNAARFPHWRSRTIGFSEFGEEQNRWQVHAAQHFDAFLRILRGKAAVNSGPPMWPMIGDEATWLTQALHPATHRGGRVQH